GFQCVVECLLPILSPKPVMGEQRCTLSGKSLLRRRRRNSLFENLGNCGMQLLAPTAQQGPIGSVLHEGVLEDERFFRRRAAAENQSGIDQLVERLAQLITRAAR